AHRSSSRESTEHLYGRVFRQGFESLSAGFPRSCRKSAGGPRLTCDSRSVRRSILATGTCLDPGPVVEIAPGAKPLRRYKTEEPDGRDILHATVQRSRSPGRSRD